MILIFSNMAIFVSRILLAIATLVASPVMGKCRKSSAFDGHLWVYCDVALAEDYTALSSLDPDTVGLICNIPGIFNETLANFSHLQRLRTLQFESPSTYASYTLAQTSFRRADVFWNLTMLEDLQVNIILIRFNWDTIRYLTNLRVLDFHIRRWIMTS